MNILQKQLKELGDELADLNYVLKDTQKSLAHHDGTFNTLIKYRNYWLTTVYASNPPLYEEHLTEHETKRNKCQQWCDELREQIDTQLEKYRAVLGKMAMDNIQKFEFINGELPAVDFGTGEQINLFP